MTHRTVSRGPGSTESPTRPESLDGVGTIRVVLVDDHSVITDGLSTLLSGSHDIEIVGKASGGGAGVGLYIVERIVRGGGGRVWVESEPGVGSRFYFTLPKPGAEDR